jgi:hypothetical protein
MTRGRLSNHAYIDTDTCHGELDILSDEREARPARTVLEQVLTNLGAEQSAHTLQSRLAARAATNHGPDHYRPRAARPSEQAGMSR